MDNKNLEFSLPELSKQLDNFGKLNSARAAELFSGVTDDNLYTIVALAEEVGELAGAVKKLRRGFNSREFNKILKLYKSDEPHPTYAEAEKIWLEKKKLSLAKEAADIFTYLSLFCERNQIDLASATVDKFNEVTVEMVKNLHHLPKELHDELINKYQL